MAEDVEATRLALKIDAKATELLAPLRREMDRLSWPAEYREIMWNAVAKKALRYASNA